MMDWKQLAHAKRIERIGHHKKNFGTSYTDLKNVSVKLRSWLEVNMIMRTAKGCCLQFMFWWKWMTTLNLNQSFPGTSGCLGANRCDVSDREKVRHQKCYMDSRMGGCCWIWTIWQKTGDCLWGTGLVDNLYSIGKNRCEAGKKSIKWKTSLKVHSTCAHGFLKRLLEEKMVTLQKEVIGKKSHSHNLLYSIMLVRLRTTRVYDWCTKTQRF